MLASIIFWKVGGCGWGGEREYWSGTSHDVSTPWPAVLHSTLATREPGTVVAEMELRKRVKHAYCDTS